MFRKRVNELVRSYITAHHTNIMVTPGMCRYNFHCHANSVHDAVQEGHKKIAMVVYFDSGSPIVHFINYSEKTKKFIDNTLGYWVCSVDYYFIRWVDISEFNDVYKIHRSYREQLKKKVPWILRVLSKFDC